MLPDAISLYKWQEWSLHHCALKFRDKKVEPGYQYVDLCRVKKDTDMLLKTSANVSKLLALTTKFYV